MRARCTWILSLLALPTAAQLEGGTLLADFNTAPTVVGSFSGIEAEAGGRVYFNAVDAFSGEGFRLWSTDGSSGGTVQLSDSALHVLESVSLPSGELVFLADELGVGVGLWRSDGSAAGTLRVQAPLDWIAPPKDLVLYDDAVWFLASLPGLGLEVWRSDLSTGTTQLFQELVPGPASGATQLFAGAGSLFIAGPGQTNLFVSDGSPAAPSFVASFAQAESSSFGQALDLGTRVLFNIGGLGPDAGWWSSDGSAPGTQKLASTFNDFWIAGTATKAFFTAGSAFNVPRLFESDGTPAGTLPVDLPNGSGGQEVDFAAGGCLGDELYYSGRVPGAGFELCRTSGAAAGAQLLVDLNLNGDSDPTEFVAFEGQVYFRADNGQTGREIWRYDPVLEQASLTADLLPGPQSGIVGVPPTLAAAAQGVVYGHNFPLVGVEPGVVDAQSSGLLLNIGLEGESEGSDPREFVRLGSLALFSAFADGVGNELFVTDGTPAGTQLLADIHPGPPGPFGLVGSFPRHLVRFGDRVYFFADHPSFGRELWSSDGTPGGTQLVLDAVPGPTGSEPLFSAPPVALDDRLYWIARETSGALGLYATDGTPGGAAHVVTTDPSGVLAELVRLVRVGDRLVFPAEGPIGLEVWTSDGTAAGTELLIDLSPGVDGTFVSELTGGANVGYINATAQGQSVLVRTDGTPAGTSIFFSVPFTIFDGPGQLHGVGDQLLFSFSTPNEGREPWVSDGTSAGTRLLKDVAPGPDSSVPVGFLNSAERVYFAVESPTGSNHYQQLWSTDLTEPGTQLVAELPSPVAGAGVGQLWAGGVDGGLVFSNVDDNGQEWWASDGTLAGTFAVSDLAPGPQFASPRPGVLLGNQLVFAASDGVHGEEPFALDLAAFARSAATPLGQGCAGAAGTPLLSAELGPLGLGDSAQLQLANGLPGSLALWFFDGAYVGPPALGNCAVQLPAPKLLAQSSHDVAGEAFLSLPIPNSASLVGAQLDVQALSVEVGGPFLGLGALSGVLELIVGP